MVFSAVALVAFSFAGMANNEVNEKKSKKETTDSKEQIESFLLLKQMPTNCEDCYIYADGLDDGSDPKLIDWRHNMNVCYTSNGCDEPFPGY